MSSRPLLLCCFVAFASHACKGSEKSAEQERQAPADSVDEPMASEPASPASTIVEAPKRKSEKKASEVSQFDGKDRDYRSESAGSAGEMDAEESPNAARASGILGGLASAEEAAPRSRSWFPETFLFDPLVVTDAKGAATVSVTVPDRLTSWRVLALAHSRSGSQAGATTEFLGTLPSYVDPIVPPRLRVGDRVRIPIQLVNTTATPLRSELRVSAVGASIAAPPPNVSVPANGTTIVYANVTAETAGTMELTAVLGGTDAVVRTAEIIPVGKRLDESKSATLAAPRSVALGEVAGKRLADRVRLEVFPGALAILRSELSASSDRGGLAADAFTLLLAGKAPGLLTKFGDEPNTAALRTMTILATQRIVRHARVLNVESATLLAQAALAHPQNAILEGLGRRAVAHLETHQLPDGSCGGETGWTLQRLLVATADCARAAASERGVVVRASGAFERHAEHVRDPYTAAAILAAKPAIDSAFADALRETLTKAIKRSDTGTAWIPVPDGVVRADGRRPTVVEASALAALALVDDAAHSEAAADLGATVLAGYSSRNGWGDGRTNLVATEALVRIFNQPIPEGVSISLARDGEVVASGTLDAKNVRDVLILAAANVDAGAAHKWTVAAKPAVAGLGFNLERSAWIVWPPQARTNGLEIEATPPAGLAVNKTSVWRIVALAPAGNNFTIELEVPAGVQIDRASLEGIAGLSRFELNDESLTLYVNSLSPGRSFEAELKVAPTLAGKLQSGPQTVTMSSVKTSAPPTVWTIK